MNESTAEEAPARSAALLREVLGKHLMRLRDEAEFTRQAAADAVGISPSTVRRAETAEHKVAVNHIKALLDLYLGEDEEKSGEKKELEALARRAMRLDWWDEDPRWNFLSDSERRTLEVEAGAEHIRVYSTLIMPQHVLSPRYAQSQVRANRDPHAADRLVLLERRQHTLLQHESAPRLSIVLNEAILRCKVGSPDVMVEQIDHLIKLQETGKVTIQIHPLTAGPTAAALMGTWALLSFHASELPDRVATAGLRGNTFLNLNRTEVDYHRKTMDRAARQATSVGQETVEKMMEVRGMWSAMS